MLILDRLFFFTSVNKSKQFYYNSGISCEHAGCKKSDCFFYFILGDTFHCNFLINHWATRYTNVLAPKSEMNKHNFCQVSWRGGCIRSYYFDLPVFQFIRYLEELSINFKELLWTYGNGLNRREQGVNPGIISCVQVTLLVILLVGRCHFTLKKFFKKIKVNFKEIL